MRERASQEQLLDYFASYVSPQKVKMYAMWGVDFIPGRREGYASGTTMASALGSTAAAPAACSTSATGRRA